MLEKIEQVDRDLFLTLNGLHADWLDSIMWYLSSIWLMVPVFGYAVFYAYKKGQLKLALTLLFGIGLCVLLSDRISVEFFKEVFQRYRPTHNTEIGHLVHTIIDPNGNEYRGGLFSFVSSHATNSFSIVVFVFLHLRAYSKTWNLLFLWAVIVCYTRIYLGVHYPADLVCGGLLGTGIGFFVYWISTRLLSRFSTPKSVLNNG